MKTYTCKMAQKITLKPHNSKQAYPVPQILRIRNVVTAALAQTD